MLRWFNEDEREVCPACGVRAAVTMPSALTLCCLACGVVVIDGERIELRTLADASSG
jgi:hypothetical protein